MTNNNTTDTENNSKTFSIGISSTGSKTLALVLVALVAMSTFAAAAPSGITAGSASNSTTNIDITAEDDSVITDGTETRGVYFEVTNNDGSYNITVDSVTVYDSSGSQVATASPAVQVSTNSMVPFTTRSTSDNGAFTLGIDVPETVDNNASMDVTYTRNGTQYTETVSLDLNQDDDGDTDSLDAFPLNAPQTADLTVNTSEGSPSQLSATVSNGSFDVEFQKYNSTSGAYETLNTTTVSASSSTESATYDISGAEDGQKYRIVTEGTGTVESTQILYDTSSGGGSTDSSALFNLPSIPGKYAVGGGAIVVVVAALYVLREDY